MNPELSLSEKLILLATDEKKGHIVTEVGLTLEYCIAGTILFELIEKGLIKCEDEKVIEWPRQSTGFALYDLALKKLMGLQQVKRLSYWIERLASQSQETRHYLLEGLVEKGILEKQEKAFLWVFHLQRYPERDATPENHIRERLLSIIKGFTVPDEEDLVLLGIVKSAELISIAFPKPIRKEAKIRIEALIQENRFTGEISRMIKDIQTAILTVMIASVTVIVAT